MGIAGSRHQKGLPVGSKAWSLSSNIRVTNIKAAQAAVDELSRQLLRLQEEERQRIAVELHDSTSQHLIALELNLMNLRRKIARGEALDTTIDEMEMSVHEAQKEIRIFSYLLHPPHLECDGLRSTIRRFVEGFSRRSGLSAQVKVALAVDHLPLDLQLCILRVVQEALANVHRHAEASGVEVDLALRGELLVIRVKDDGKGISADQVPSVLGAVGPWDMTPRLPLGLGLPGMRVRLQQFGGTLEINGNTVGTDVRATIPLSPRRAGKYAASTHGD